MPVVSCGRPLPGYRLRIVDPQGNPLPERREGLLRFQGPSATRGHYRNPEATAGLIRDGWHDTGDRGYLVGGELHLTGRVKDMIIRGGRNLYPYEVEEAVGELEGVRKGCVVAFAAADRARGSERLVLVAETRERDPERRRALEGAVRERATDVLGLPPDEIVLAPPRAIPKTSSGKLRRGATRERCGVGSADGRAAHAALAVDTGRRGRTLEPIQTAGPRGPGPALRRLCLAPVRLDRGLGVARDHARSAPRLALGHRTGRGLAAASSRVIPVGSEFLIEVRLPTFCGGS